MNSLFITKRLCTFEPEIVVDNRVPNEAKQRAENLGLIRNNAFLNNDKQLIL